MNFQTICQAAVAHRGSDVIMHEGEFPVIRVGGELCSVPGSERLDAAFFGDLWQAGRVAPDVREADTAIVLPDGQRFRANLFHQLGRRAAVLRVVQRDVPRLDALGLPTQVIRNWLAQRAGMVLVTGPTNSGKSTTLAACISEISQTVPRHIITVEDPVEFAFPPAQSVITQREVGIDTPSFAQALRQALRQSPDVILIGEIRDSDSAVTAVQASETGHLVLASVHGSRATDAVERLTLLLPPDLRPMLTRVVAANLLGVVAQRLIIDKNGDRVAAVEYFSNIGAMRPLIEQTRLEELRQLIDRSGPETASSQNASLLRLFRDGRISEMEALAASDTRSDLSLQLKGITHS